MTICPSCETVLGLLLIHSLTRFEKVLFLKHPCKGERYVTDYTSSSDPRDRGLHNCLHEISYWCPETSARKETQSI